MKNLRRTELMAMFGFTPKQLRRQYTQGFHNLVKYLVRLRRDGVLDDDDFNELMKMASAAFIEAEVATIETEIEDKVERVLEDKIPMDYLLGLWK
ncbi:hypothetical protein [Candidatus Thiosymbion oneisti]|uniref:hypothetical protein n=1 Tax=Candidatus Thiosymbion oneisti TaxID=589554 RepID=UPI00114D1183|nr:hypothetical protein [Candidatus Thiosymbion oneisti]